MPLALIETVSEATAVWAWVVFGVVVLGLLALDLFVFNRKPHASGLGQAALWVALWVGLAVGFNVGVYFWEGKDLALQFSTAYLLEESLSVDNLFIFLVIFRFFGVAPEFQHRVLFWGILGALVMRGVMIFLGVALIVRFHWISFVFGAFLLFTGIKLFLMKDESHDPSRTWAFKLTKKYVPLTGRLHGERFFVLENGRWMATPLFLVLVIIETTDLVFALDSIPACLGVSKDLFIVYTSNIFAILGLRSLYFLLAGAFARLRLLKPALSLVLIFIALKMILAELHEAYQVAWALKIPTGVSLGVVGGILGLAVAGSLLLPVQTSPEASGPTAKEGAPPPPPDSESKS